MRAFHAEVDGRLLDVVGETIDSVTESLMARFPDAVEISVAPWSAQAPAAPKKFRVATTRRVSCWSAEAQGVKP